MRSNRLATDPLHANPSDTRAPAGTQTRQLGAETHAPEKVEPADKPSELAAAEPKYVMTPEEFVAVESLASRQKAAKRAPRMKVSTAGEKPRLVPDHPDSFVGHLLLMEALGSVDPAFMQGLLAQLANAGSRGPEISLTGVNFMLSVIKGIEPKDPMEAMLAAQMAAVHMASMTLARRLSGVETVPQQDSAERALNKLMRTFTAQMDALKRYRTGGQQRVVVEHVTVNKGGQAIVGHVTQAGNGAAEKQADKPKVIAEARNAPISIGMDAEQAPDLVERGLKEQ